MLINDLSEYKIECCEILSEEEEEEEKKEYSSLV